MRAGLARAVVHVRGARRRVPGGHAGGHSRSRSIARSPRWGRPAGCPPEHGPAAGWHERTRRAARTPSSSAPVTTGWSPPATSRAPDSKVQVLERNDYIGGAAVSRQPVPGLHLLQLLVRLQPAAAGDHARTWNCRSTACRSFLTKAALHDDARRRPPGAATTITTPCAARSRATPTRDAEAYDRYSRDVMRHCKFIKPLLMREPPDPDLVQAARPAWSCCILGKRFHELGEERMYDTHALLHHERGGLPRRILRERDRQGAPGRQLDHRHRARARARRARPTCCCTTTWATSTTPSAPGASRAAAWGPSPQALARIAAGERRRDPRRRAGGEQILVRKRTRHRRRAGRRRGDPRADWWSRTSTCKRTFLETMDAEGPAWRVRASRCSNFKIRGSSGKLNIALDGLPEFPVDPAGLARHRAATCTSPTPSR